MNPLASDNTSRSLGFRSNKIRLALNSAIENEAKDETASTIGIAQEDRNYALQAAIVRYVVTFGFLSGADSSSLSIMKARKMLSNNVLTQEVISQASRHFVPKVADIKKVRSLRSYLDAATIFYHNAGHRTASRSRIHHAFGRIYKHLRLHVMIHPSSPHHTMACAYDGLFHYLRTLKPLLISVYCFQMSVKRILINKETHIREPFLKRSRHI